MSNSKDLDKKLSKWEAKAKTCIKWLAVDANGSVWGFDKVPSVNDEYKEWNEYGIEVFQIGTTNDKELRKNWKNTLRKVRYE